MKKLFFILAYILPCLFAHVAYAKYPWPEKYQGVIAIHELQLQLMAENRGNEFIDILEKQRNDVKKDESMLEIYYYLSLLIASEKNDSNQIFDYLIKGFETYEDSPLFIKPYLFIAWDAGYRDNVYDICERIKHKREKYDEKLNNMFDDLVMPVCEMLEVSMTPVTAEFLLEEYKKNPALAGIHYRNQVIAFKGHITDIVRTGKETLVYCQPDSDSPERVIVRYIPSTTSHEYQKGECCIFTGIVGAFVNGERLHMEGKLSSPCIRKFPH